MNIKKYTYNDELFYNDLDKSFKRAFELIEMGVIDRNHPFHTPTIAFLHNNCPTACTLVLRGFEPQALVFLFHTDVRSRKIFDINLNSKIALHFYDRDAKIQLRINGTATVFTDNNLVDEAWTRASRSSRECYRAVVAPGTVLTEPNDMFAGQVSRKNNGRKYFSVLKVKMNK